MMSASSSSLSRTMTASKRDANAAELQQKPSARKRQLLNSTFAHASLERQVATLQASKVELETKLREKDIAIATLERDRRWLSEREAEERAEKEKEQLEREEEKKKLNAELRSLRTSLTTLRDEHEDLQEAHSALSRSATQSSASQRTQISQLTRQVTALNDELAQTKALADDRLRAIDALHAEFDGLQTRPPPDDQNMEVIREELHRQADYLRQLEMANTKLKAELARNGNVDVLREEKRTLERRVRGMDELRRRVAELEGQVDASRREREDWANKSIEHSPGSIPVSVTQQVTELRLAHAQALEEVGATKALLRTKEAQVAEMQQREADALSKISDLEGIIRALEGRKQQVGLLEKEVSFLKALVASFEAEQEGLPDERVADLETLLADYKRTNAALSVELDRLRAMAPQADLQEAKDAKESLAAALEQSQAECAEQVKRIDTLEQELFELSGEIAGGRHVPPGVRVLSLRQNPLQEWVDIREEVVRRLQHENEVLIQRLAKVGSTPSNDDDGVVPRESYDLVNKEKLELKAKVEQGEKRLLRLKEIYRHKSEEFRAVVESLLGVKLAFYPNGQTRVTSMYNLKATYVFLSTGVGEMRLVAQGQEGPQDLSEAMDYWVGTEACIPGFMATMTLECYEAAKQRGFADE